MLMTVMSVGEREPQDPSWPQDLQGFHGACDDGCGTMSAALDVSVMSLSDNDSVGDDDDGERDDEVGQGTWAMGGKVGDVSVCSHSTCDGDSGGWCCQR